MSLKVDLVWRGNFGERVKKRIGRVLTTTCRDFFRRVGGVGLVTLKVFGPDSTRRSEGRAISVAPAHLIDNQDNQGGVPVYVKCDKHAQLGYLIVEGMTSDELRNFIIMGQLSRQVFQRVATSDRLAIEVVEHSSGELRDVHDGGAIVDSQSESPDASRSTDDPHEKLRSFWRGILVSHKDDVLEGFFVLKNEQLTLYANAGLEVARNAAKMTRFYFDCVRPFGESVGKGKQKGWRLDVMALQAFISGGPLTKRKLHSGHKTRVAKKLDIGLSESREPDAVLNELEELLKRIEVANLLQNEQSNLQTVQGVNEGTLKELDAQIATVERTLAELRGKRDALKQIIKSNNIRLEEIEALLVRNKVSDDTIRRLQEMGVLKGSAGNENTVMKLVAQSGKP